MTVLPGFIAATTAGSSPDIVVVTERWYSPELKIQLLARIADPRAADTSESSQAWIVMNQTHPHFKFPPTTRSKP
jgi:hypothetical protein